MSSTDLVDPADLNTIAVQVFRQALEDYIHLQHPSTRTKKYIQEAYLSSIDMFWDPTYRIDAFKNDEGNPMNLEEFLLLAASRENLDIEAFHQFLLKETVTYWKDKLVNTVVIPDVMTICAVPYDISHTEDPYRVDYDNRVLYINKLPGEENNHEFLAAVIEIICFHKDLRVAAATRKSLGTAIYETLKLNNSFREQKS